MPEDMKKSGNISYLMFTSLCKFQVNFANDDGVIDYNYRGFSGYLGIRNDLEYYGGQRPLNSLKPLKHS